MPSPSGMNFNGSTLTAISGVFTDLSINGNSFDAAVSGLLPVTNIVAGTGISIVADSGSFTINSIKQVFSPEEITTSQNDYVIPSSGIIRLSSSSAIDITGFASGVDGQTSLLVNVGSYDITLKHQDSLSAAENRFISPLATDTVVGASGGSTSVFYDTTSTAWRIF